MRLIEAGTTSRIIVAVAISFVVLLASLTILDAEVRTGDDSTTVPVAGPGPGPAAAESSPKLKPRLGAGGRKRVLLPRPAAWAPSALALILAACRAPAGGGGGTEQLAADASGAREPGRARIELRSADGRERSFDWSATSNMVRCRHYAEPERGDYLWIRLGETGEADGDAGVRLDIDVCRLGSIAGPLARMPAGDHGSHCAATPGFAIWWHERDAAFHSGADAGAGPEGDGEPCELELELVDDRVHGAFACAPLVAETKTGPELSLAAGSFTCALERASAGEG